MRWLRQLVDVRRGERGQTLAMFAYIFLIIATLTMVKSVRQALFLQKFGAASLPYVYLLIAVVAGTIATIYQRLARNAPIHRLMIGALLVVISNLVIFRFLIDLKWGPLTYILYVWVAIYGILTTVQFWTFANYLYDPRQAKRLFALLGVGATAGGIAGGYITQFGARILGTENLMLVGAVFMGCNALLAFYLWRSQKATIAEAARARRYKVSSAKKTAGGFRLIWESRYLKLIMLIIALSIIISTVVDNQFGFVVEENIPDKDGKASFYGQFFSWLGWASFLMQFLVTSRLIRRFGIGVAMLVLPVSLFLGSGVFVLIPMLATGLLVKIADGTFRYTVHKASLELLYLPMSVGVKNKTKAFIDMFTDRFSKGLAAVLILVMTTVLGYGYHTLSWVLMGLAILWIGVVVITRREYVRAFRDSLLRRKIDDDALLVSPTDAATIGALAEALQPGNPTRIEKTLKTIAGVKSPQFIEPLVRLAHDRNPQTAITALDRLAEQDDPSIAERVEDLLDDAPIMVAERALHLSCLEEGDIPEKATAFLQDRRPRVRLAAILCLARLGDTRPVEQIGAETLEELLADPDLDTAECQREISGILAELPSGKTAQTYIGRFLRSDDREVVKRTISAAGKSKSREFVEPLINFLGNRHLRYLARDALAAYGETAAGTLEDYFHDRQTTRSIRQYLPRVFERLGTQRGVDILIQALDDGDQQVRFSALRSLGRLRAKHPELNYASKKIVTRLELEIRKAYRYQWWNLTIDEGEESALLRKTLREKSEKTIDRIFRLLAMDHPPEALYTAFRAIFSDNARIRANAIEYLDNVLKAPHRPKVLGLVEGRPRAENLQRELAGFNEPAEQWPRVLKNQAAIDDDWLAACALYTVYATGQESMYGLLNQAAAAREKSRPLVIETASRLVAQLKGR
ncbi:Npt1/Npt2 family nucleotide transporter [Candidatus Zixiibacteriota bacterium]